MASFEKTYGRELLGDELSCLSFWLLADEQQKGWLDAEELTPLMKAFKFNQLFHDGPLTADKLRKEFEFLLSSAPYELPWDGRGDLVRFDFIRSIFLERGL